MKLRIKGNTLRVRVSRSEVARLLAADLLEETIYFTPEPTAKLTYALQQDQSLSRPSRDFVGHKRSSGNRRGDRFRKPWVSWATD